MFGTTRTTRRKRARTATASARRGVARGSSEATRSRATSRTARTSQCSALHDAAPRWCSAARWRGTCVHVTARRARSHHAGAAAFAHCGRADAASSSVSAPHEADFCREIDLTPAAMAAVACAKTALRRGRRRDALEERLTRPSGVTHGTWCAYRAAWTFSAARWTMGRTRSHASDRAACSRWWSGGETRYVETPDYYRYITLCANPSHCYLTRSPYHISDARSISTHTSSGTSGA